MTFVPGTLLGRYELLELLDGGRLSEVYRARDTSIGREVAVKVLPRGLAEDPVWLRRFEQESRAAGQLDHPNILSIHDVGIHEGRPYLVSEWLDGENLREHLTTRRLSLRKAVAYGVQIAQGIAAAHERGIVHRDLKPENLFVTRDSRIKILDFGLARVLPAAISDSAAESPTAGTATEPGVILGTVGYMSPEQVRGEPADARSDIFGFGSVFYEMVAGRRAFHAGSGIETMIAILREDPPPIPPQSDCPATLERIILRCLEKRPGERFQSARDLAYALEDFLAGARDRVTPPAPRSSAASSTSGGVRSSRSRKERRRQSADHSARESGFWLILQDREIPLREGETIVGRARDATVRVHEKSVSRHHARIAIGGGEVTVENLHSKNGTYVRGERIESSTRLCDGDEIRLGSLSMVFRIAPSTASTESQSGT